MTTADAACAFIRLLRRAPASRTATLLTLMMLSGITEGLGIVLLVPFLEAVQPYADHPTSNLWSLLQQALGGITPGQLLIAFVALIALRSLIQYAREQQAIRLQHTLVDDLRRSCFNALLKAQWRWLVEHRRSDHESLLLSDINRVGAGLNFGLSMLTSLLTTLVYVIAAAWLSWQMTLLAVLSGSLVLLLFNGQRRHALQLGQQLSSAARSMHANVQDSLTGIKLSKILGREESHLNLFDQATHNLRLQQERFAAKTGKTKALVQCSGIALLAFYLYLGLTIWPIEQAKLLTLILIFARLIPLFVALQQQFHQWLHALPALLASEDLLSQSLAAAEPAAKPNSAWSVKHSIRLSGVSVRYAGRSEAVLQELTLQLPSCSTTAIVGASGAGKSTLADVIAGMLTADEGRLEVDGIIIDRDNQLSWRRSVAYVTQEVFLFNDSIRNNLLWGSERAHEEDLRKALYQAAAEFVFTLPHGLDTLIGDAGVRLSGGERQRLALARALLRKPALLILDEATSALDCDNEARIRDAIANLQGALTILIIGHRLPALEKAEHVIVLNKGRLIAQGDWATIGSKAESTQ